MSWRSFPTTFLEVEKMKGRSILVVSVLVVLTILAIAGIWTRVIPRYRATAEVRVRPFIPYLVFRTEDNGKIRRYRSFVNTQASVIKSEAVLLRALDQKEVMQTQWYKNLSKSFVQRLGRNPPAPRDRLRDALSAKPRKGTEIIDVSFMAGSAEDAQVIVNTVLDQYMRYIGERSDATQDAIYDQLAEQYKAMENEIQGREQVCAQLCRSLGTETPQELISAKRIRLDETQASLAELRQKIAVLKSQAAPNDTNDAPVEATGTIEHQLAQARQQEQFLLADIEKQHTEFDKLFHTAQLLEKENAALLHKHQLFDAVRQRLDQKNMERNAPGPIEVLTRAVTPSEPYSDRRVLFTVIALGLCLGMGSSLMFLLRTRIGEGDKSQQT